MLAEARAMWMVDRPNLFIKVPATVDGLPAITASLAEGISINVTLIFSLARYEQVVEAWLTGMEQAQQAGRDLSRLGSVASLFVSRLDTETDARLDDIGSTQALALRGTAAIANARLAYQRYERMISTDRWRALAQAGAQPQRPLWASTSVKDPAYPDTRYVTDLVAPNVVSTMPETTLDAVADHGSIPDRVIQETYDDAQAVLDALTGVGVSYDDVVARLEQEGIRTFAEAWAGVAATVDAALNEPTDH